MTDPLEVVVRIVLVGLAALVLPLVAGQVEHKVLAHIQGRVGPMYAGGYHGWAQLIADGIKFAQKDDVLPAGADRVAYRVAPGAALIPYLVVLAFLPLAPGWVGVDAAAGVLVVVALINVAVIGTMLGGLAGGTRLLSGALRNASEVLSSQLAFVLAAISVATAAGTLSLTGIVERWSPWWLAWQAVGFAVFFTSGLAVLRRRPFDAPWAGLRGAAGFAGLRFAAFVFAEYAAVLVLCGLTTVLYLGGWRGPGPEALAPVWTLGKVFLLVGVVVWVGATLPRLRADQLRRLVWRTLLPLAVLQLAITTVVVL